MKNFLLFVLLTLATAVVSFAPDTAADGQQLVNWEAQGIVKLVRMES
jgi:hypothetical protein